jgi:4-hydroxy-2-oxoheptanedioate aldolase
MDLAASLGHLGNPAHPDVQSVICRVEEMVLKSGKALCTLAAGFKQAEVLFEKGYQMVTLMADGVALAKLAAEQVANFRKAYPQGS